MDERATTALRETTARARSRRRWSVAALGLALVLAVGFAAGFLLFANQVDRQEPPLSGRAQGMIALTGGADRIADAIELLARGHADRLLITGVNPSITRHEIAKLNPRFRELIDCCVDLGYEALNTVGNAIEAQRWAAERGVTRTLIVVTSNYHMPRALAELRRALPGFELIPYPVVGLRMREWSWWRSPHAIRVIGTEYLKYLVSAARLVLTRWTPGEETRARA